MTRARGAITAPLALLMVWAGLTRPWDYAGPARWERSHITVSADAGVDVDTLAGVLSQWSGQWVTLTMVPTGGDIHVWAGHPEGDHGGEATPTLEHGYITHCDIITDRISDPGILAHEVGHCLGLSHSPGRHTVMRWVAHDYDGGWSDTVTPSDIADVAMLYHSIK